MIGRAVVDEPRYKGGYQGRRDDRGGAVWSCYGEGKRAAHRYHERADRSRDQGRGDPIPERWRKRTRKDQCCKRDAIDEGNDARDRAAEEIICHPCYDAAGSNMVLNHVDDYSSSVFRLLQASQSIMPMT